MNAPSSADMKAASGEPARDTSTFEATAERVDKAVKAALALDREPREVSLELQAAVEEFHRAPIVEIVKRLRSDPRGKELLFELVDDPAVHALFTLHGIIRINPFVRAQQALDTIRPYLQSHGGDCDLLSVEGDTATVRLRGSCNGCSMSAVTLREGVEEALVRLVPEIKTVKVAENEPTEAFIPLGSIGRKKTVDDGWRGGPEVSEIPSEGMLRFDLNDESYIITNVGSRIAAFRNECVHQGMTLDGGVIDEGVLICPWHGFRFDASSGECLSAPGAQLRQVPLTVEAGRVRLRAN